MFNKDKAPKEPKTPKAPKEPKAPKLNKNGKEKKTVAERGNRIIGNPVRILAIFAVISGVIGLVLYQFYGDYKSYIDYIIGGIIVALGVISLVYYFAREMVDGVYRSEFAIGIICICFGIYVAINGGATFSFLVIVGIMCAVDGIVKFQYTFDLARMHFKQWWVMLVLSVLGLAIGLVVLMGVLGEVFENDEVPYTGLVFCLNALLDVVAAVVIAVRNHKANKEVDAAVVLAASTVSNHVLGEEELAPVVQTPADFFGETVPVEAPAEEPEAAESPAEPFFPVVEEPTAEIVAEEPAAEAAEEAAPAPSLFPTEEAPAETEAAAEAAETAEPAETTAPSEQDAAAEAAE